MYISNIHIKFIIKSGCETMLVDIQTPSKNHFKERIESIERELITVTDKTKNMLKEVGYSNLEIDNMMSNGIGKVIQYLNERTMDILKIVEEMKGIKIC